MIITNGSTFSTSDEVYIGYNTGCNSNWISITDSEWDMSSSTLYVGSNSTCIGNNLIVGSGAVVDRAEAIVVSSNNILTVRGGVIRARTLTVEGTLEGQGSIGTLLSGVSGTTVLAAGSVLKPTAAFSLANVSLPTNMTVDASSLTGTTLISYSDTVSGATDLSGWTVVNGPAGYIPKLNTGLKRVVLSPPNFALRVHDGKVYVREGRLLMTK